MATQLSDEFLYNEATGPADASANISKGKSMAYVIDLNQGSYTNGIITLDATNQLNGSQGYASLRDAYITVPLVATIKNSGAGALSGAATAITQFVAGLKCNTSTIIDKVQIELNGKAIVTSSGYLSHWNNLRALTEWSDDDIKTYGSSAMLFPDDVSSIGFSSSAGPSGDGFFNNTNQVNATLSGTNAASIEIGCNTGFVKRQQANPPVISVGGSANTPTGWPTMTAGTMSSFSTLTGKGATTAGAVASGQTDATFYYLLRIRLVDIHPIFKTLDLVANPQLKMALYVNTGTSNITVAAGSMSLASSTITQGSTCPIMVSSAAINNGFNTNVSGSTTTLQLAWGVMGNSITTSGAGSFYPYSTT